MAESLVALTYGNALYEAAGECGKREIILEEIRALARLIETEPKLAEFLHSPAVSADEKKELIETTFREKISGEMLNFLFVLIDKGRTWHLGRIARQYDLLYDRESGHSSGKIYSAHLLSEEQVERAAREMSDLLQKEVSLVNEVDRQLIGGVKIQVDGKVIDRSVKAELAQMLKNLKE